MPAISNSSNDKREQQESGDYIILDILIVTLFRFLFS